MAERSKAFPLYFYDPASEKHAHFHASRAVIRILSGGNRSSKSHSGVAECLASVVGYRPWILRQMGLPMPEKPWIRPDNLPEEAIVFNGAGIRIAVPAEHFLVSGLPMKKGVGEVLHPKVKQLAGPLIDREWMQHGGVPGAVRFKNGSMLHYGSDEQDRMAFEGTNYASIGIDEPIRRQVYTAIRRGAIDQFARITMTFTPIGRNAAWIFTDLYNERDTRRVEIFNVRIFDNKFLSPEAIQEFLADPTLSELEKQARVYGKFQHLLDRIYPQFKVETNVVDPFKPPADWFVGMVVDPATIKPWFIAYFTITPRGDIFFFKEWPLGDFVKQRKDGRSIEAYAQLIRELDSDLPVAVRLMDPNYGPRSDNVRGVYIPSVRDDMARYGIHFDCHISDDLEYGEAKVRQLLHYDDKRPVDALNYPRLKITENCGNLINSLLYYTFRVRPQSEDPDEEKREEKYKDGADCVRYVACKLADVSPAFDFNPSWDDPAYQESIANYGEDYADAS